MLLNNGEIIAKKKEVYNILIGKLVETMVQNWRPESLNRFLYLAVNQRSLQVFEYLIYNHIRVGIVVVSAFKHQ